MDFIPLTKYTIKFSDPRVQKIYIIKDGDRTIAEVNPQQLLDRNYDERYKKIENYVVYRQVRIFGKGGTFYLSICTEAYCSSEDAAKKYIETMKTKFPELY